MLVDAVRDAGQATKQDLAEWVMGAGFDDVRPADWNILRLLGVEPVSTTALADWLGITQQAVSKAVGSLEVREYVIRTTSPADGRRRRVLLTEGGRSLLACGSTWARAQQGSAVSRWGTDEVQRTTEVLCSLVETSRDGRN